ncbi:hypothetical protein [Microbacterium trichothecenolyticum]|uniref:Uncharacterized protein n=1 Tax=Microbacterium trichothecenolyticum TaxID=69370 RepID=A0A0M2HM95_MICTR|nr:hypothetical protein [Microbacterium trichothecenolyticum]KJL45573.1 hypothetical protein RS82_00125 [Microbacterium trichothecenolyticum]
MHPDRRREGRAIRKARREAAAQLPDALEALSTLATIAADTFDHLGRVIAQFAEAVAGSLEEWQRRWLWKLAEYERKEFEWRLAHRALTTGK